MDSSRILNAKHPKDIFSTKMENIKKEYRDLAKTWHPDVNKSPIAGDVFAKLTKLYELALELSKNKTMEQLITVVSSQGKKHQLRYNISHDFELGTMYIGNSVIMYFIKKEFEIYYKNTIYQINQLKYADTSMKNEFKKYMPTIIDSFESKEHYVVVMKKTDELVLLKDLLYYFDNQIPHKHVAWIMSSLYNLACFMHFNKIAHNSISIDNYLVSPLYHSGVLTGGWWYAKPQGDKMIGVKKETFMVMPTKSKNSKESNIKTDLESIKLIGRQLLGNPSGSELNKIKDLPEPFINWLKNTSSDNPYEEYNRWMKVLRESYGERKFIPMEIDTQAFYSKVNDNYYI